MKKKIPKTAVAPRIEDIEIALDAAGDRLAGSATSTSKKNYAQALSTSLAIKVADALRPDFRGILPTSDGRGAESRARTGKGFKRLDVNFSTLELGLALGVSLKSVNFPEGKNKNYAKNVTRVDNELRAEAEDYHLRQPYAVLVAMYFVPIESTSNATERKPSSFGHMVRILRHRTQRRSPTDGPSLFEKIFIGLYEPDGSQRGQVSFFDVEQDPPYQGKPQVTLTFSETIGEIRRVFELRNNTKFVWSDLGVSRDDPSTSDDEVIDGDD